MGHSWSRSLYSLVDDVVKEHGTFILSWTDLVSCQVDGEDIIMTADTDLFPVSTDFLKPLRQDFKIWVFWWEAVLFLKESFPLGLLAMKARVWSDLMKSSRTVTELTRLPGSSRRVFTSENKTTDTWEIDQSVTTTAILR